MSLAAVNAPGSVGWRVMRVVRLPSARRLRPCGVWPSSRYCARTRALGRRPSRWRWIPPSPGPLYCLPGDVQGTLWTRLRWPWLSPVKISPVRFSMVWVSIVWVSMV